MSSGESKEEGVYAILRSGDGFIDVPMVLVLCAQPGPTGRLSRRGMEAKRATVEADGAAAYGVTLFRRIFVPALLYFR